ncbi:MAG: hypothetical protein HYX52_06715 [Chloroflexi bacterium]|nr:hypothetical protein [Chloroflexota bacterium]
MRRHEHLVKNGGESPARVRCEATHGAAGSASRRLAPRTLFTGLLILFLTWFATSSFTDYSNDSEVEAYSQALYAAVSSGRVLQADGWSALSDVLAWLPMAAIRIAGSGAYLGKGFFAMRFFQCLVIFGLGNLYYRALGIRWGTRMAGLALLAWAIAYASYERGWELPSFTQAALFVSAGYLLTIPSLSIGWIAPLAFLAPFDGAAGLLLPWLALLRPGPWTPRDRRLLAGVAAIGLIPFGALHAGEIAPAVASAGTLWASALRTLGRNLDPRTLASLLAGLAFVPVLAFAWSRDTSPGLRRVLWALGPPWLAAALVIQPLGQGALLLPPVAAIFLPVVLTAVEAAVRRYNTAGEDSGTF